MDNIVQCVSVVAGVGWQLVRVKVKVSVGVLLKWEFGKCVMRPFHDRRNEAVPE